MSVLPEITTGTISEHLPVLQIVVPILAAPLIVLFGRPKLAWLIAFIGALLSFVISILLLESVIDGQVISYHLGGFAPPLGIEYRIDAANALVSVIICAIATITLPFAIKSVASEIDPSKHSLFYACFMLCFTGMLGVVITGDAFNVFVFLEISSLSTYVLVAMGAERDKRALTAAYDYLVMGTIGATFFVIGIGFLYMSTGTLNMADMAERIGELHDNRTVHAAFAFIVVGIGLKIAIYPLHLWLPSAYTYAPSAVTVFLASTATKMAIYVLIRFIFTIFSPEFALQGMTLEFIILPFALLAMFAGSIAAIFQYDLKRLLAYSSIAQIGYMLLGISFLSATGLSATLIHLFNHAITKAALFMGVGIFVLNTGSSFVYKLKGLGKLMPWTSAAMVIAGLSLIGIPGTAGFISKWILVQAALENGLWPIALLVGFSSLLAIIYVWKLVETLYFKSATDETLVINTPASMAVPMWILTLACIWFGVNSGVMLEASQIAAENLIATD